MWWYILKEERLLALNAEDPSKESVTTTAMSERDVIRILVAFSPAGSLFTHLAPADDPFLNLVAMSRRRDYLCRCDWRLGLIFRRPEVGFDGRPSASCICGVLGSREWRGATNAKGVSRRELW